MSKPCPTCRGTQLVCFPPVNGEGFAEYGLCEDCINGQVSDEDDNSQENEK
jgi:hypothetical protein